MKVTPPSDQLRSHLTLKKSDVLGSTHPNQIWSHLQLPLLRGVPHAALCGGPNSWFSEAGIWGIFSVFFLNKYCTVFWKEPGSLTLLTWQILEENPGDWSIVSWGVNFHHCLGGTIWELGSGEGQEAWCVPWTDTEGRNCCLWSVGLYYVSERKIKAALISFLVMHDNRAQNPHPNSWTHQLPDQLSHIHKQERLFHGNSLEQIYLCYILKHTAMELIFGKALVLSKVWSVWKWQFKVSTFDLKNHWLVFL